MVPPCSDRMARVPPYSRTCNPVSRTGLSPAAARLSRRFRYQKSQATGLVRFRSPLLAESRLMSFPPATEMFQFAGFASPPYEFSRGYPRGWVAPFGDPGINDRSHLPRAFRSVPRPSSPLSAKASTRCPYFALERHTQRQGPSDSRPKGDNRGATDSPSRETTRQCAKLCLLEDTSSRDPTRRPPTHPSRISGPPTVSRYGHTTRFFTIINQHMPRRPNGRRRQFLSLRRVLPLATAKISKRRSAFEGQGTARTKRRLHR